MKLILRLNNRNTSAHRFKELDASLHDYSDIIMRAWAGNIHLKPEAPEPRIADLTEMLRRNFSDIIREARIVSE